MRKNGFLWQRGWALRSCHNYTHIYETERSSSLYGHKAGSCVAAVGARRVRALSVIHISLPVPSRHTAHSQPLQLVVRNPIHSLRKSFTSNYWLPLLGLIHRTVNDLLIDKWYEHTLTDRICNIHNILISLTELSGKINNIRINSAI
jgi:hypothetical protein